MTIEVVAMTGAGIAALASGLAIAGPRLRSASRIDRLLTLGPVCEATALAIFAAEHLTAAHDLAPIVPHWLPWHLFWVSFFGVALLAAAVSFVIRRCVGTAAALLALFFLLIVVTLDLPGIAKGFHDRFYWILTCRETCFAGGAMVLAGSALAAGVRRRARSAGKLVRTGRYMVAGVMIFYSIQHFLHPRHVAGVPLEKLTPAWVPAPVLIAWIVGLSLLLGGVGLFVRPIARLSAASAGTVLLLLNALFYLPLCIAEFHTTPVDGLNYLGDTLLFAGTVLLAGLDAVVPPAVTEPSFVGGPALITSDT